jgi:ABC-2 type transport system ATP-binding protein
VQWRDKGELKSEETENPTALVATLTTQFAGEIPELSVTRPSLEDIYLKMIGHADE